ncbi:ABC transporter permease [Saccharibacillus sacchari]|uniref:ABC transporter permease n=1 Tax=Saccharibacillus sacchari TaxID=456493 RepID=UPI0004AE39F4|nr:ABC transporter permease [Saccharibacillus sacchari]
MSGNSVFAGLAAPGALFRRRLHDYIAGERRNLSLVVDWVVALYIIIPFSLLGLRYYYGFWHGEIPAVFEHMPLAVLGLLPLLTALASRPILLLEPADAVFLRQRPGWLRGVLGRASTGFVVFQFGKSVLIFLLLLPFLREGYELPWESLAVLYLMIWTLHAVIGMLTHFVGVFRKEWLKRWAFILGTVAASVLFIWAMANGTAISGLVTVLFGAVAGILTHKRSMLSHHFEESTAVDLAARLRFTALLLSQSMDKPRLPKQKVRLQRRSGPLLPSFMGKWQTRQVADAALKSALRERGYARMYLQFSSVSLAATIVGPLWVGWIVVPLMLLLFSMWLRGLWLQFAEHAFPPVATMDRVLLDSACGPAVGLQMLPIAFALSACLGVKMFAAWWGAVALGLPGAAVGMLLAYMLAAFWQKKEGAA